MKGTLQINRLKVILVEQRRTSKWLAQQLNKNETTTVSRWCINEVQLSIENLIRIANLMDVDVKDLLNSTKLV